VVNVSIMVTEGPAENPYYADFPDTIKALNERIVLTDRGYEIGLIEDDAKLIRYTLSLSTDMTLDELRDLYHDEYEDCEGFEVSEDEYNALVFFNDGTHDISVNIIKSQTQTGRIMIHIVCCPPVDSD